MNLRAALRGSPIFRFRQWLIQERRNAEGTSDQHDHSYLDSRSPMVLLCHFPRAPLEIGVPEVLEEPVGLGLSDVSLLGNGLNGWLHVSVSSNSEVLSAVLDIRSLEVGTCRPSSPQRSSIYTKISSRPATSAALQMCRWAVAWGNLIIFLISSMIATQTTSNMEEQTLNILCLKFYM